MESWQERTAILLGEDSLKNLNGKRVLIVGVGGVGAYAAEMLCRAGVGNLVLLDNDVVNLSNKNRQLIALDSTIGLPKCDVLAHRLKDINSELNLETVCQYLERENVEQLFASVGCVDYVVDAIDTLAPKISLIKYCYNNKIPFVSSMGSGAKMDVTKIRIADISKSYNCPLAYMLRKKLRKEGINKGFKVVFSEELPNKDAIVPMEERNKKSQVGTISYLPAVFGCACAQAAIEYLVNANIDN